MKIRISEDKKRTKAKELAQLKKKGWKVFKGDIEDLEYAIALVANANGEEVAICFNERQAYVIQDSIGLFELSDYKTELKKNSEHYKGNAANVEGVKVIAVMGDDFQFQFTSYATPLGLDHYALQEELEILLKGLVNLYDGGDMYEEYD